MNKLWACIQNENMKLYSRVSTRIMIGLSVLIPLISSLIQAGVSSSSLTLWSFVYQHVEFFGSVLIMFAIIVAASSVSNEFTKGTIKLLLIRPVSRSKVLLSKYVACVIFSLILLAIVFGVSLIAGFFVYGWADPTQANLTTMDGTRVQSPVFHLLSTVLFVFVDLLMMMTIAFMMSTIFRHQAMSVGFTMFLRFTGPNIVIVLKQYEWAKYLLFSNMNLRQYIGGVSLIEDLTMLFSVIILLIHFCLMTTCTWWIFHKRDVAG